MFVNLNICYSACWDIPIKYNMYGEPQGWGDKSNLYIFRSFHPSSFTGPNKPEGDSFTSSL
jgi:hypothetical protein